MPPGDPRGPGLPATPLGPGSPGMPVPLGPGAPVQCTKENHRNKKYSKGTDKLDFNKS